MSAQRHNDTGWRAKDLDKIGKPRGPKRALNDALSLLPPFEPDPDGGLPKEIYGDDGALLPSVPRCKALALAEIDFAARQFNVYEHFHERSPKNTEVEQELKSLGNRVRQLRREIEGLSDEARILLKTAGTRNPKSSPLMSVDWLRQMPEPFTESKDSEYVKQFRAFEEHILKTQDNFRAGRGLTNAASKDPGGNKNFFSDQHGNPRWFLAGQSILTFERFGLRPTTTEGGPLHLLAQLTYEYATGRDPESSKMLPWLKACLGNLRQNRTARQKANELRTQYEALIASGLPDDHPRVCEAASKFLAADKAHYNAIMTNIRGGRVPKASRL